MSVMAHSDIRATCYSLCSIEAGSSHGCIECPYSLGSHPFNYRQVWEVLTTHCSREAVQMFAKILSVVGVVATVVATILAAITYRDSKVQDGVLNQTAPIKPGVSIQQSWGNNNINISGDGNVVNRR